MQQGWKEGGRVEGGREGGRREGVWKEGEGGKKGRGRKDGGREGGRKGREGGGRREGEYKHIIPHSLPQMDHSDCAAPETRPSGQQHGKEVQRRPAFSPAVSSPAQEHHCGGQGILQND